MQIKTTKTAQKNVEKDFNWYLKKAEEGDARAQNEVGKYYYEGKNGAEKNFEEAFKWWMEAAKQDFAEAQINVGWCFRNGEGVKEDNKKAFKWWMEAAKQNFAEAQINVGICFDYGEGVEKDKKEAFEWYMKAAEQGNDVAQLNIGMCYYLGEGVTENKKKAFEWYMKAAEQGNDVAQLKVGKCYNKGEGIEESKREAFKWFHRAARQGNDIAQRLVGFAYSKGYGVKENNRLAFLWYRRSAKQGNARAQLKVGICYYEGIGVEKNMEEALKWLKKAAEQGNVTAQSLLSSYHKKDDGGCKDGLGTKLSTALNAVKKEGLEDNIKLFSRLDEIAKDITEIKEKISSNTNIQIEPNKEPKAFVIMQFGEDFDALYEYVIKPTCKNFGYESRRADKCYYASSIVLQDIVSEIVNSSLIIVDISMDNPNVFYELGYAHALNKPTILLADNNKRKKLPFDTQGYRTIFYKNSFAGKQELEETLSKYMKNMQKSVPDKKQ